MTDTKSSARKLRTREFVWVPESSERRYGWLPVDAPPDFYPGNGHIVAHDTVEHLSNGSSWKHELLTFGVTMFGRMRMDRGMANVSASDFVGFFSEHGYSVPKPLKRWDKPLTAEGESMLAQFKHYIAMHLKMEISYKLANGGRFEHTGEDVKRALNDAVIWFKHGWRIAERLHGKDSGHNLMQMFDYLSHEVTNDTLLHPPHPGERLTVRVDRKAQSYSLQRRRGA
jgi:hypothetical protein